MRSDSNSIVILLVAILMSVCHLWAQSFPPPKPITDEEQIRLVLIDLEQSIKSQNMLRLLHGFADDVQFGDSTASRDELKGRFQTVFSRAANRREDSLFQLITPSGADLTATWDFELDIDTLSILNDRTAQVKAWIYFGASPPDSTSDWRFGRKHRENIMFKKVDGEWRVKRIGKLLRVLNELGNV